MNNTDYTAAFVPPRVVGECAVSRNTVPKMDNIFKIQRNITTTTIYLVLIATKSWEKKPAKETQQKTQQKIKWKSVFKNNQKKKLFL